MTTQASNRRVYAEDLQVGEVTQLDSYTVTSDELLAFASRWDPQFFHVDLEAAAAGYFGGIIGSGIHTLAIFQRLSVQSRALEWQVIAGRGIRDLRFVRPVRPGDTLTGSTVVESVRFEAAARALVITSGQLVNQHGEPVLSLSMESYMKMRKERR
jgi:acyl dehydratase